MLRLDLEKIPPEMRARRQWVCWKIEVREGKPTKVPVNPKTGGNALANEPATWGIFEEAVGHYQAHQGNGVAGVGFEFSQADPYVGIDLDKCLDPDTGEIEAWAKSIIERLRSYTEISPSGRGVHIIVKGKLPAGGNRKDNVEIYSHGRYFTMTGQHLEGTPTTIEPRQAELEALHRELFAKPKATPRDPGPSPALSLSDQELIDKGHQAANGEKFARLWRGDISEYGDDDNKADLALCSLLVFWCGPDPERIERLFRQSGLMREKWEKRADYRERTISKAITDTTAFYTPHQAGAGKTYPQKGTSQQPERPWPTLGEAAYHGVGGQFAKLVEPHTEADPAALLLQFQAGAGNLLGRGVSIMVDGSAHGLNIFPVMVGDTGAGGRKGTSWSHPRRILTSADETWADRIQGGLSSGEGLVWAVRDPIYRKQWIKAKKGESGHYEDVLEDAGIDDKRLLAFEPEFASILKVLTREGSILSTIIRQTWDSGDLRVMTKRSPAKATGAHVSIIGHITPSELKHHLTETEAANGFGNRFLWACVRRSKLLPFGGELSKVDFQPVFSKLAQARTWATSPRELTWDEPARRLWEEAYPNLTAARPGMAGALLARSEAQAVRLAAIYAALACSPCIREDHLQAALAVVDYCEQSVFHLFGDASGDYVADRILLALRNSPKGLTRAQISDLFERNVAGGRLEAALSSLLSTGKALTERRETGGRPSEVWFAKT
jgi:hypothetical protein